MKLSVLSSKITYILCLVFFISGCHSFYGINAKEKLPTDSTITCEEYLQSISIFWQKKEGGYYEFIPGSPNFYGRFVQNTNICFQGFSSIQIKRHLGVPNLETETGIVIFKY